MTAIINGSSPSVTFSDGTTQATSAIVSGYVPYANLPAGSVLQVVQGTLTGAASGTSTSSSSFVTTTLSLSITPKSSSNKVLLFVDGSCYNGTGGSNNWFTIYRNGSNVNTGTSPATLHGTYVAGASSVIPVNIVYLDSPATTSAITYTVYFACGSGTAIYPFNPSNTGNTIATITAMEIAV